MEYNFEQFVKKEHKNGRNYTGVCVPKKKNIYLYVTKDLALHFKRLNFERVNIFLDKENKVIKIAKTENKEGFEVLWMQIKAGLFESIESGKYVVFQSDTNEFILKKD